MSKPRKRERWLADFGYVLTADEMRSKRQDYVYDVFAGSKPLACSWLTVVATLGGGAGRHPRERRAVALARSGAVVARGYDRDRHRHPPRDPRGIRFVPRLPRRLDLLLEHADRAGRDVGGA